MNYALDVLFYLFIFMCPFFYGLYFENNFITSLIFLVLYLITYLINKNIKNKKDKDKKEKEIKNININHNKKIIKNVILMSIIILLISIMTYFINYIFYNINVDYKLLFYGTMQLLEMIFVVVITLIRLKDKIEDNNYELEKTNEERAIILSSFFMSLLIFFKEFYRQKRFEGTFYYANATGMFLLMSLIITINYKAKNKLEKIFKYIIIVLNIASIILTNSRFTYLLLLLYLFIMFISFIFNKIKNKKINNNKNNNDNNVIKIFSLKNIFITSVIFIVIILSSVILLKNENIRNRFHISTVERDINLRLSYLDEANIIIKEYPFGLGYEGYLAHQEMKENKYKLRLVHNMPYQIILNYGFIMGLISLIFFIMYIKECIKNKKILNIENLILLLLILHSLIDIGVSFLAITNIVLMLNARNILKEE